MTHFTFLTEDQIIGNTALEVIKKYGREASPTDLAIVLGSPEYGNETGTCEGEPTCDYWTSTSILGEYVSLIDGWGINGAVYPGMAKKTCIRPALSPEETAKIQPDEERPPILGVACCTWGEFPQTIADKKTRCRLGNAYKKGLLKETGKKYTFNGIDVCNQHDAFKPIAYPEFEYKGDRYVRVLSYTRYGYMSDGTASKVGRYYWMKVEPLEWLKDPTGWWVTRKCLLSGVEFDNKLYKGDFDKTRISRYINTYFAKESRPLRQKSKKRQKTRTITVHAAHHKASPNCCRTQNER